MKILTRMSIVLFVLLLGMTVGSVSILRDLVHQLEQDAWTAVHSGQEAEAAACAETLGEMQLSALLSRLETRYQWLGARLAWLARDKDLREVLDKAGEGPVQAPMLAARLDALRAEMPALWVVRPDGVPVQVVAKRVRGRQDTLGRTPQGGRPVPGSLEPLKNRVLDGHVAFDIRSVEVGKGGTSRNASTGGGSETRRDSEGESLWLVLGVPVRSDSGDVVGAVFGSLDLDWQGLVTKEGAQGNEGAVVGAALSVQGERRAAVGEGYRARTMVSAAIAQGLQGTKWYTHATASSVQVAAPIGWAGAPPKTLVELTIQPPRRHVLSRQAMTEAWPGRVRKASALEALMAVLVLALGIEGARRAIRPLNRLLKRADLVSTGKLDASFKDLSGRSEVGELARCFERMRISIHKLMDRHDDQVSGQEVEAPSGSVTGEMRTLSGDKEA